MSWYTLKSDCIFQVAREIARPRLLMLPNDTHPNRHAEWKRLATEAEPEAIEKIKNMSNLELLDLISEVAGQNAG